MKSAFSIVFTLLTFQAQTSAFSTQGGKHRLGQSKLYSTSTKSDFPEGLISVVKIDPATYGKDDDQVMQVASYRNQRTSPAQMIAAQQAKRDSFDPVQSALQGVKIGVGIGAAAGIISTIGAENGASIQDQLFTGLKNFAVIGGTTVRTNMK